jgi:uncharacterized protein YdaU (DUF1376 family)
MNKDPAFLFYSSDFLTGTMLMSNEQTGKYIRLLCLQHQKGGRLTHKDMIGICGTCDEDIFDKFEVDEAGLYYNVRLDAEMRRRSAYSESRRQNRLSKSQEDTSQSYVPHMETETETATKTKTIPKKPVTESRAFRPPTLEEVALYCTERKNMVDPQVWLDYYTSNGWKVGKNSMKDWKAAVRTWEKNNFGSSTSRSSPRKPSNMGNFKQREYSDEDLEFLFTDVSGLAETEGGLK